MYLPEDEIPLVPQALLLHSVEECWHGERRFRDYFPLCSRPGPRHVLHFCPRDVWDVQDVAVMLNLLSMMPLADTSDRNPLTNFLIVMQTCAITQSSNLLETLV